MWFDEQNYKFVQQLIVVVAQYLICLFHRSSIQTQHKGASLIEFTALTAMLNRHIVQISM